MVNGMKVMTFNVCYPGERSPNSWRERYPVMVNLLRSAKPDLIGTQEGFFEHLQTLRHDLPEYRWFGGGREGGSRGEHMAVFYREAVFELLEHGDYWLSETPEVPGSSSWNSAYPRMVTWGLLRHRFSGREFVIVNTHLDHISQEARNQGVKLLSERLRAYADKPVVLTGDFNEGPAGPVYQILVNRDGWMDSYAHLMGNIDSNTGTYHDYRDFDACGPHRRIDWILARGAWRVCSYQKLEYCENNQYPSDHYPVMVELEELEDEQ